MGTFATSWAAGDTLPASELNTISGAWTSYTPTIGGAGWALGNGTVSGAYKKIGRVVVCRFSVTWGTTSTFGASALTISLPFAAAFSGPVGTCSIRDLSVGFYDGVVDVSGSACSPLCHNSAGTYTTQAGCTTTVPFTWVNGDSIVAAGFVYESTT